MTLESKLGETKKIAKRGIFALTLAALPLVCTECNYSGSTKPSAKASYAYVEKAAPRTTYN